MDSAGFRALGLRYSPTSLCSPPFTALFAGFALRRNFPRPTSLPPPQSSRKHALFIRPASASAVPISDCIERNDVNSCNGSPIAIDEAPRHKLLRIVLVSPQIPGNTGAIARTCAASAVGLHLVEPLGYTIDDAKLKRAGLDYWPYPSSEMIPEHYDCSIIFNVHSRDLSVPIFISVPSMEMNKLQQDGEKRLLAFTKRGTSIHSNFSYRRGDWLVFGSETTGLPPEALLDCSREGIGGGGTIRIPMVETYVRCLNLSVSVGIALYEAARQLNYEQLQHQPAANSQNLFLSESEDIYG